MKTTRIVLFLMVLSILWCADVFAHWFDENWNAVDNDTGKPAAHFRPGTSEDPCFGTGCDTGEDYIGGHGHIDERHSSGEARSWGYWTPCGYAIASENSAEGCGDGDDNTDNTDNT